MLVVSVPKALMTLWMGCSFSINFLTGDHWCIEKLLIFICWSSSHSPFWIINSISFASYLLENVYVLSAFHSEIAIDIGIGITYLKCTHIIYTSTFLWHITCIFPDSLCHWGPPVPYQILMLLVGIFTVPRGLFHWTSQKNTMNGFVH